MSSKHTAAVQDILARAHSPDSADRIYRDKVQHKHLFLRPQSPPPGEVNAREARRRAREEKKRQRKALKPKPLSARQRRQLGLYDVPRAGQKYATFEPLHALWLGYIREIMGGDIYIGGQGAAAKLTSADFHGAQVEVVRSACVGRVGIQGIVIKDAKHVFEIVTKKDKVKIVPKEDTVFKVEVPATGGSPDEMATKENDGKRSIIFEVHGDQFLYRSADRANRKFKPHFLKNV